MFAGIHLQPQPVLPSNMGDDLPSPFAWPIFAARGGEEAVKHEGDAEFVHGEEEAR